MATATATRKPAAKATKQGNATTSAAGIGAKQVAAQLGTDGRALRKFLRAQGSGVGRGTRYTFTQVQAAKLAAAWAAAHPQQ